MNVRFGGADAVADAEDPDKKNIAVPTAAAAAAAAGSLFLFLLLVVVVVVAFVDIYVKQGETTRKNRGRGAEASRLDGRHGADNAVWLS